MDMINGISRIDWKQVCSDLDQKGFARIPNILTESDCLTLRRHYNDNSLYRNVINMKRYRFGLGEYKYYSYPLPSVIEELRMATYSEIAPLANDWMSKLKLSQRYPDQHDKLISLCHDQGQKRPTPLILKYEKGGFNTLHQDLYGDLFFPFQMVCMLSKPSVEFTGGQFVMVEQIPRAQSRAHVIELARGDAMIFTCNYRPVQGIRGFYRCNMKHGVSEVISGERYALGIIYHDAK